MTKKTRWLRVRSRRDRASSPRKWATGSTRLWESSMSRCTSGLIGRRPTRLRRQGVLITVLVQGCQGIWARSEILGENLRASRPMPPLSRISRTAFSRRKLCPSSRSRHSWWSPSPSKSTSCSRQSTSEMKSSRELLSRLSRKGRGKSWSSCGRGRGISRHRRIRCPLVIHRTQRAVFRKMIPVSTTWKRISSCRRGKRQW